MRNRDEELAKHSKKLTAISFIIIVFILGGGEFNQQPEYLSGLIHFENVYVIPITVVIVFLFYCYRFWVWQRKPIQYSKNQFYDSLKKDTKFNNYFVEKSKEKIQQNIENSVQIGSKVWESDEDGRPTEATYDPGIHKKRGSFAKKIAAKTKGKSTGSVGKIEVTLDMKRFYHLFRVKLRSILYDQEYTYRVLPFWLAFVAFLCISYALITELLVA